MASINTIINLTDQMSETLNKITGATDELVGGLENIASSQQTTQNKVNNFTFDTFIKNAEAAGKKIEDVGKKMSLAISTPLLLLGKKMYDASTDYETGFAGMRKTVEGTVEQYEHLNQVAQEISETTPTNYVEAMGIMQTGGNLGVAIENQEAFLHSYSALVAASDQHIVGEKGASDVAHFLQITDGGVQNIERFGSSMIHLGNNFAATEDQILGMGNRMASAAHLAGIMTPEILGMSTAFTAVGINAEAGGSAASMLIKQMQLAAEVGAKAQSLLGGEYENATGFSYFISDKSNLLTVAQQLGTTTEQVQRLGDSWLSLEQFSEVSGKTAEQFTADWGKSPAQGMVDFFYGLNAVGDSGVDSTLSMLDEMGLTEIRLSNLVAAMAVNPELFASAIQESTKAYGENMAMWVEFEKQISTQEAQNTMLGNKMQNSMADLGDNVVKAVQPALDAVNGVLDAFNGLSEVDQGRLVALMGALVIGGPALTVIAKTTQAISGIAGGIKTIVTNAPKWQESLTNFFSGIDKDSGGWTSKISGIFNNPAVWGVAAGAGAVAILIAALESIPTTAEEIAASLKDFKITVDQDSVNQTLVAIAEVQAAADLLAGGQVTQDAENTSEAVKRGYGTETMYGGAIGYEAAKAQAELDKIATDYTAQIREAEGKIINAQSDLEREALYGSIKTLESQMNAATAAAKARYTTAISDLYGGMISRFPELAGLEQASTQYDLLGMINEMWNIDTGNESNWPRFEELKQAIYDKAIQSGLLEGYDDLPLSAVGNHLGLFMTLQDELMAGLRDNAQTISQNPVMGNFLQAILNSGAATNLDLTQTQGALDGAIEALDFVGAIKSAEGAGDVNQWGAYTTIGFADGVLSEAGTAENAIASVGIRAIERLLSLFQMGSPSRLMATFGVWIVQGLANGMLEGIPFFADALAQLQSLATENADSMTKAIYPTVESNVEPRAIYPTVEPNLNQVGKLQQMLTQSGFALEKYGVDQIMGRETGTALQNMLVSKGYQLPKYGVDGIVGGETTTALQKMLTDNGYQLPEFGIDGVWGSETQAALDQMIADIEIKGGTFTTAIQNAFGGGETVGGAQIIEGIVAGLTSGTDQLTTSMSTMAQSAVNGASTVMSAMEGISIGNQIINGMTSAITSGSSTVANALVSLAAGAVQAAKNALGIASPSRVFMGIGAFTVEGFIQGLEASGRSVNRAMNDLVSVEKANLAGDVWDMIDTYNKLERAQMTARNKSKVKISDDDIKRMRELAEREVINRFTTAKLNIKFDTTNKIESNMDLDGVIAYMEEKVTERLEMAAEGVYDD